MHEARLFVSTRMRYICSASQMPVAASNKGYSGQTGTGSTLPVLLVMEGLYAAVNRENIVRFATPHDRQTASAMVTTHNYPWRFC